jgi:hypothetical protein
MNTKLSTRLLIVFALVAILLAACGGSGPNLKEEIIGAWEIYDEDMDMTMVFDFQEEGQLAISVEGISLDGSYTWEDDDTIKITMSFAGESEDLVGDVAINGDQMTITADGDTETFTRVK